MNKLIKKYQNYFFPVLVIIALSFARIIPHPSNFTPILAVGIFSGFYFKNFIFSFFIVIFSMFLGDVYLGFHSTMFFTYTSLSLAVLIGFFIKKLNFKEVVFGGLASSACFFIITNFGVWILSPMYEKSFAGLMHSYIMGIPFFHNTLISTLLYLLLFKLLFLNFKKKNIVESSV